ncbi:MAG TPA: Lrp/AsnC family transcriptional regulator [Ktedonobacterales bacterium]|jgi:DNA-binding Lrp family transcriptional regulator
MVERFSESRAGVRALDRIDQVLLTALQAAGRIRLEDLAQQVELAPSSVHDRLRRLQRDGVIRRWTIDIAPEALGLSVLAYVGVQASRPCAELVGTLEQIREIEEFHSVAGQLSFILKLRATNTEHLLQLVERLKQIPGVERTETTVVLKTHLERGPVVKRA